MSRRPRSSARGTRGGSGRRTPPAPLELPQTIPGLAAWFDSRSAGYFATSGGAISAWASRAGSLGTSIALAQGTAANQPIYVPSAATMNGQPAVSFDGVNDFLQMASIAGWAFLHNNTGATIFTVERVDSTGVSDQYVCSTFDGTAATRGMAQQMRTASATLLVSNGSGAWLNQWAVVDPPHYARNVSRWRAWTYGGGEQASWVSGGNQLQPDSGAASASAPLYGLRVSRAAMPLKGLITQVLVYARVLDYTEINTTLAADWAAPIYGVAA